MNKRFSKNIFLGTIATTILFHTLGNCSIVSFASSVNTDVSSADVSSYASDDEYAVAGDSYSVFDNADESPEDANGSYDSEKVDSKLIEDIKDSEDLGKAEESYESEESKESDELLESEESEESAELDELNENESEISEDNGAFHELTYDNAFDYELVVDDITVTAHADAGIIPDGSVLNVERVDEDFEAKVAEAAKDLSSDDDILELDDTYTFDITITNDKVEGSIQPENEGAVTITFSDVLDEDSADDDTYLTVYYVQVNETAEDDEIVESLTKVSDSENDTTDISFEAYHFSRYTIVSNREQGATTYTPAEYTPRAYKILSGTTKSLEEGEFTFTIVRTDENGNAYENGSDLYYVESGVSNDSNGMITFSTLTFDTPDTYYFKITEDIPEDSAKDPHITYDDNYYILRIYVSTFIDDATKLVANPVYCKNGSLAPVSVNLYDYYGPTINAGHAFKFSDGSSYYDNDTKYAANGFNKYTTKSAKDKRYTGIVSSELVNGYPVLNKSVTGSDESLAYLFTQSDGIVDRKENVILYEVAEGDTYTYKNSWFLPFNKNGLKESTDSNNYHFSAVTEAAFIIPTTGQVYSGSDLTTPQDMIYSFEGDDDVWVFIDGKLVADLGGVHDKVGASINFNSGVIQYFQYSNGNEGDRVYTKTASLKDVLGSDWKDGQVHTLKVFYFERGKYLSEFDSTFNLALIAEFNNVYSDTEGDDENPEDTTEETSEETPEETTEDTTEDTPTSSTDTTSTTEISTRRLADTTEDSTSEDNSTSENSTTEDNTVENSISDTPQVLGASRDTVLPMQTPEVLGENRARSTGDESKIATRVLMIVLCIALIVLVLMISKRPNEERKLITIKIKNKE